MTQDQLWLNKYQEVVAFIETNKRNPSKFIPEERELRNRIRHQQKSVNRDELKPERMELYKELLALMAKYKRINQYT